uniref:Pecanex-like protein n=1 Tax=Strongyloides stercoralis TaxID=6248 RepID=A0AAF5I448_STRER
MTILKHFMEVCRQGFWASLTGGWYYDPASSKFCNTLHLYLWLYLFISPSLLGYLFDNNLTIIDGTIVVTFLFIKLTIFHFHTMFDNNEPCKSIVVKRKIKKTNIGLQSRNLTKQNVRKRSRTSRRTSVPPGRRSNQRVDLMIPIKTIEQINALRERNYAALHALECISIRYQNRNTRASSIHEIPTTNQPQNNSNNVSSNIKSINNIELPSSLPGPSGLSITNNEKINERKYSDPAENVFSLPLEDNNVIKRTYSLYLPKTSVKCQNDEERENLKCNYEEDNYDDIPITITEMLNETCDEIKNDIKDDGKEKDSKKLVLSSRVKRRSKGEWIPETVDINFAMDVLPIEQRKIATILKRGEILDEDNWFMRALKSLGEIDFLKSLEKGCTEATVLKCEIISFMESLQRKYPIAFTCLDDIIKKINNTIPTETVNEDEKNNINNDFIEISDPDQPGPSNVNLLSQKGNNIHYDNNLHENNSKIVKKNSRSSFHFQYPDFSTRHHSTDGPECEKDIIKNNGCDLEYDVRNILSNLMKSSINHNFNENIDRPSTRRVKIQQHHPVKKIITRHTDHLSIHSILTLSDDEVEKNLFYDGNQRYGNVNPQERDSYWRSDSSLSSIINNQNSFRTNFRGLTSFIETFQNTRNRGNKKRQQSSDGLKYRIANFYELQNDYCKKFPSIRLQMDRLYIIGVSIYFYSFVVAGAHFSLLKSVQPDTSSPEMIQYTYSGTLPQITTLFMHLFEQMDIYSNNPIRKLRDAFIRMKIRNRNNRRRRNRKNTNPLEKSDKNKSIKDNIIFNTSPIKNDDKKEFTENVEMKELLDDDGENPAFQGIKDTYMNDVLNTIGIRFQHDLFSMPFIMLIFFALHSTLLFHILQPWLERVLVIMSITIGFYNHYLYPHFRAKNPWKPAEFFEFESKEEAGKEITAYSQPYTLYSSLFFTYLLIYYDFSNWYGEFGNEIILWYLLTIIWPKIQELRLKLDFIFAYIAPWQISWGSAFHAFVQPFSAPHSGFLALVTFLSSILSAPLNPFLGSSFFLMSYMRPIKFWEKDYNTKQYDFTNAKLCDQMESTPTIDVSNLNAVFYEHMTRSLQKYLAGDLAMGRWGSKVEQVHVIEVGNGFVTFQLRGLEFHGTYCHQREVEAISEDPPDIGKFFCFYFKGLFGFLPINTMLSFKWMAWEVTASKYIIDGYSITDNSAINLLQVHELRRLLVTLYVKSIIYYALNSKKFYDWISNTNIKHSLKDVIMRTFYFDDDSFHFNSANDEDFDTRKRGISRVSFNNVYKKWILFCLNKTIDIKHPKRTKAMNDTNLITAFCFALSLVGRRILSSAAYSHHSNAAEAFLHGLHSMFKGDFRVTAAQDEWVFQDLSILNKVISPAVRMALKLHQDHFASSDDLDVMETLYLKIGNYHTQIFISHEHDPLWRSAVMANIPSLLALRHVFDDGTNDFKVIMLNKMYLNMRVIKLNRECVRAFWAGQQQELIFLRNRNAERGSIQNAKQVLRNMINSSADQPIGYPIYVSPLTTSYVETHHQIEEILGGSFSINNIVSFLQKGITFLREMLTTSNSTNMTQNNFDGREPISIVIGDRGCDHQPIENIKNVIKPNKIDNDIKQIGSCDKSKEKYPSASYHVKTPSGNNAQNVVLKLVPGSKTDSVTKVYHSVNGDDILSTGNVKIPEEDDCYIKIEDEKIDENIDIIESDEVKYVIDNDNNDTTVVEDNDSLLTKTRSKNDIGKWAKIIDNSFVQDHLNEKMKSLNRYIVLWPSEEWRLFGGLKNWPSFPHNGWIGNIVHVWSPFNPDPMYRSHAGFIYLVKIKLPVKDVEKVVDDGVEKKNDDQNSNVVYVPISEEGIILIEKDNN